MAFKKNTGFKAPRMKKNNTVRNLGFYLAVGGVILLAFAGLQLETGKYKKEVNVVSLKAEVGAKVIEEMDLKSYTIPQKALKDGMILWKDRETEILNKYPSMQIRRDTPVYKDMLTDKPITRYQYLYELAPDEELLTFNYENLKAAGRIPRPGDRFRIRGSYKLTQEELEMEKLKLQSETAEGSADVIDADGNVVIKKTDEKSTLEGDVRTAVVFDVATVVDMLNQSGDSIFEILRDFEALSVADREKVSKEDTFKQSLTPNSLLIIVKSAPVGRYVQFNANTSVQYTLTLLTRDKSLMEDDIRSGTSIIDSIVVPKGDDN